PMATHRIAMHVANMVMSSHHATGETFQKHAESSRRNIKSAGLKPDTVCIRYPETVIVEVSVGDEVFAAPSIRLEAVGATVKCSERHGLSFFCEENHRARN